MRSTSFRSHCLQRSLEVRLAAEKQKQSNDSDVDNGGVPNPEASEKLKAAASISTPRQDEIESDAEANGNNANATRPRISIAEKLKAAAAAEKLKNDTTDAIVKPDAARRSRAKTKLLTAVAVAKFTGATIPYGNYAYLQKQDIPTLSNDKLRKHLGARGADTSGGKKELIERLLESLEEEKQREIAIQLELEAKHRRIADAEEKGAVYAVGKNNLGQLGIGDFEDRLNFTVLPITRGRMCQHVSTSTGANMSLATTENHEVFAWGGGGMGPMGVKGSHKSTFESPQLVVKLSGEEVVMTSIGSNHAIAISQNGDIFSWGKGQFGVLGSGDTQKAETPKFLECFDKNTCIVATSCGEQHTCIKTSQNKVYAWGHASNGRLGIGPCESGPIFQPSPLQVKLPTLQVVKQVACGSEHTLASTESSVFSWGSGDGGRLGHGPDHSDRCEPTEIVALHVVRGGSHILDISAGTWHSACVVNVAPMKDAGYLYTFGSGYQGQLGLDKTCQTSTPTLVTAFCNGQTNVKRIFCGSTHNAAVTVDGNLWTWGSNKHGALGRSIEEETKLTFTPHPGIVAEFGTIVNRIGRGLPRSVACGREYTIVATYPYDGPSEEEALQIIEMHRQRDEDERNRQEALRRAREDELRMLREQELEKKKIRYLTSKRLCTMDPKCPGFTYETNQPSICRECGFSVVFHTIVVDEQNDDGEACAHSE